MLDNKTVLHFINDQLNKKLKELNNEEIPLNNKLSILKDSKQLMDTYLHLYPSQNQFSKKGLFTQEENDIIPEKTLKKQFLQLKNKENYTIANNSTKTSSSKEQIEEKSSSFRSFSKFHSDAADKIKNRVFLTISKSPLKNSNKKSKSPKNKFTNILFGKSLQNMGKDSLETIGNLIYIYLLSFSNHFFFIYQTIKILFI